MDPYLESFCADADSLAESTVGVLAAELPAMIGVLTALPSSAKFPARVGRFPVLLSSAKLPELVGVVVTSLSSSSKLSSLERMLILALPSSAKFSAADSASWSGDTDARLDIVTEQRLSKSTCHAFVNAFLLLI